MQQKTGVSSAGVGCQRLSHEQDAVSGVHRSHDGLRRLAQRDSMATVTVITSLMR